MKDASNTFKKSDAVQWNFPGFILLGYPIDRMDASLEIGSHHIAVSHMGKAPEKTAT